MNFNKLTTILKNVSLTGVPQLNIKFTINKYQSPNCARNTKLSKPQLLQKARRI